MELPDHFEMGGRYYLLFQSAHCWGTRIDTPHRRRTSGTYYLMSERWEGGYAAPPGDNLLLGSGEGNLHCYAGRTIQHGGDRILYHHNCGSRPALGAPKIVKQSSDGSLWLGYWDELDKLETGVVLAGCDSYQACSPGKASPGKWSCADGSLRGGCEYGTSVVLFPVEARDLHLACRLLPGRAQAAMVIIRYDAERKTGTALSFDSRDGALEIGELNGAGSFNFVPRDNFYAKLKPDTKCHLRIYARAEFVDCYMDDRLVFSAVVEDLPNKGSIGLAVEGGTCTFSDLRVAELSSLD
jgi:hypothetical protein